MESDKILFRFATKSPLQFANINTKCSEDFHAKKVYLSEIERQNKDVHKLPRKPDTKCCEKLFLQNLFKVFQRQDKIVLRLVSVEKPWFGHQSLFILEF
jgi:hypothetical protein